jgi:hypothetical protein
LQTLGTTKGVNMIATVLAMLIGAVIGIGGIVLLLYLFAD